MEKVTAGEVRFSVGGILGNIVFGWAAAVEAVLSAACVVEDGDRVNKEGEKSSSCVVFLGMVRF